MLKKENRAELLAGLMLGASGTILNSIFLWESTFLRLGWAVVPYLLAPILWKIQPRCVIAFTLSMVLIDSVFWTFNQTRCCDEYLSALSLLAVLKVMPAAIVSALYLALTRKPA